MATLNAQKSLLITFISISDQYTNFFHNMATVDHIGSAKITFDRISRHFRSISNHFFEWPKITLIAYLVISETRPDNFGCPKITFVYISRHFRSKCNVHFFYKKWLLVAILDGRKALAIAFLIILDQYTFEHFITKWSFLNVRK